MKRSKIIATICSVMLLSQPLSCLAANDPTPLPTPPVTEVPNDPPMSNQQLERPPFLTLWHTSIPDNSAPEDYGLPGKDWDAYALADALDSPYKVDLFARGFPSDEIAIVEMDDDLFRDKLNEKQDILGREIELTYKLNELILAPAGGGEFPHTKNNGQQLTGIMQIAPYDGVTHHFAISEQYEVQPGDTLSQIIIDCGWLPEDKSLYGQGGYLEQFATEQHLDYNAPLIPGETIRWRSEDIPVVDNLYPDIQIGTVPCRIFSYADSDIFDRYADTTIFYYAPSDNVVPTDPE